MPIENGYSASPSVLAEPPRRVRRGVLAPRGWGVRNTRWSFDARSGKDLRRTLGESKEEDE
jgi:hypothetical protein